MRLIKHSASSRPVKVLSEHISEYTAFKILFFFSRSILIY
uniref:Uncharacterized protein n=1 Tax=Anguilla anguilla TaxID=7936 RepID=A0A0E9VYB7_ANGAN